ncbi:FMN-dependent NADH-azoreductase [Variovorax sp. OV329]|uniref:FMN-dependent NADH-azoreductase n=1 Tax=Variovorax sp. OV329 TaxID=1882825 RepID=UPI0008E81E6E|nr:NAD(P)H-dependent oxidoreductase [Variovorax sp. OV329]SFN11980.1 FMN-dependent NADH-azoreductase [Variovorax sp. OV329]
MKLLQVDSSVLGANSVSRRLTANAVADWVATHPGTEVDYLDLATDAPGHFDADVLGVRLPEGTVLSDAQKREKETTEKLISQFLAADVVVVGAPLYNFSVPSQLKAWIDRLAQPGRTFQYTEKGPVGLATGKTVIVVSTRGGIYSTTDAGQAAEHQESYLKVVFGFFGITDVRFVRAEGLAMGEQVKAQALESAAGDIRRAAAEAANQAQAAAAA